jgi:Predicted membrane protein
MLGRSRSLQIYMKPGIKEDDLMLRVWESCRRHDRPQDVFRSMLRAGLVAMLESGEMPESVIDDCGLDALLERRRARRRRPPEPQPQPQQVYAAPAYPYAVPAPGPAPVPHWPAPTAQPAQPYAPPHHASAPGQAAPPPLPATGHEKDEQEPPAPEDRHVPDEPRKQDGGKQGKGRIGNLM